MNGNHIICLDSEMTIYRAAELRQALAEELQTGQALDIDLSAVTEIDCSGIQLLMAAKKTMQAAGHEMRLIHHSPAVIDALELLNLSGCFGNAVVISAAGATGSEHTH